MNKEICGICGIEKKYNPHLEIGSKDAGNNLILDKWYCPVCDY